jgi:hypothetical protein
MKKSSTVAIAAALLFAASGVALARHTGSIDPECNKVYKAKADADKSVSSKQLAQELNMSVSKVNSCLKHLRRHGPRATPVAK